jgi:hypothetical protein
MPDSNLIIPEYRIHLLNKNKKIIEKIENVKSIVDLSEKKENKTKNFSLEKDVKKKQAPGRVLWVRKKRRISN